jgi:Ca-activated chloride channel family protein
MTFAWPEMLWLLAAAPALVAAYIFLLRRRKKAVVRFASLALVRDAMTRRQRFRRHVPPLLFLVGAVAAIIAVARPNAAIRLPSEQRTIILAIDVSRSMQATDIQPSRFVAAQEAAKTFIQEQPADVRIGIVSFAGTAAVVQAPTHSREDLVAAIDRLELQRHTATGSAVIVSLATLLPEAGIDAAAASSGQRSGEKRRSAPIEDAGKPASPAFTPVPPGSHSTGAVILLTDGRRTMGPDPVEAARMAADRGVRIYTVGFGTPRAAAVDFDGRSIYMRFDEETLRAIADITKAEYFHAATRADLATIYRGLNARFVFETRYTEVSALFTAAAALLMLFSAALSVRWFSRLV